MLCIKNHENVFTALKLQGGHDFLTKITKRRNYVKCSCNHASYSLHIGSSCFIVVPKFDLIISKGFRVVERTLFLY